MKRATATQPKHGRALSGQLLLDRDLAEIERIAELNRAADPDPEPAAVAPAKAEPRDRSALARFEAIYVSEEFGITLSDLVEHVKRDRPGIMAMAGPLGVTEEDLDWLLRADELADEALGKLRDRERVRHQESTHDFVRRVMREGRAKAAAQPDPKAEFGQLPGPWQQAVAQFLHDSGTMREFLSMRGRVTPEQLDLPGPWPEVEAFAEFALAKAWRANGGTLAELERLPEADRSALLEAQRKGLVRL